MRYSVAVGCSVGATLLLAAPLWAAPDGAAPDAAVELCDGLDNDGDGQTDETESDDAGVLLGPCPAETLCMESHPGFFQCARYCEGHKFPCRSGEESVNTRLECVCVTTDPCRQCDDTTLVDPGGEVACAPNVTGVPTCACERYACRIPCTADDCVAGTLCIEDGYAAGSCQPQGGCHVVGCPAGEVCVFEHCIEDPCTDRVCSSGRVCVVDRAGTGQCIVPPAAGGTGGAPTTPSVHDASAPSPSDAGEVGTGPAGLNPVSSGETGGCGCRVRAARSESLAAFLIAAAGVVLSTTRRRRPGR